MSAAAATIFIGSIILIVVIAALATFVLQRAAKGSSVRDETLRAGAADQVDSHSAALNSGGTTAWMRLGGGV